MYILAGIVHHIIVRLHAVMNTIIMLNSVLYFAGKIFHEDITPMSFHQDIAP